MTLVGNPKHWRKYVYFLLVVDTVSLYNRIYFSSDNLGNSQELDKAFFGTEHFQDPSM